MFYTALICAWLRLTSVWARAALHPSVRSSYRQKSPPAPNRSASWNILLCLAAASCQAPQNMILLCSTVFRLWRFLQSARHRSISSNLLVGLQMFFPLVVSSLSFQSAVLAAHKYQKSAPALFRCSMISRLVPVVVAVQPVQK